MWKILGHRGLRLIFIANMVSMLGSGLNATGVIWHIFQLTHSEMNLAVLVALQTVPGVAEVASVGGLEKQYQLKIFPPLLAKTGISLRQLITTLQSVFQQTGGRTIEVAEADFARLLVRVETHEHLADHPRGGARRLAGEQDIDEVRPILLDNRLPARERG